MSKFHTTTTYVSGGICGAIWWPDSGTYGKPVNADLRRTMARISPSPSFRDTLLLILMEEGGDFQSASFTSDTVLRVERRYVEAPGKYQVHVWEREVGQLRDCADLVNADAFVGDFMGDD